MSAFLRKGLFVIFGIITLTFAGVFVRQTFALEGFLSPIPDGQVLGAQIPFNDLNNETIKPWNNDNVTVYKPAPLAGKLVPTEIPKPSSVPTDNLTIQQFDNTTSSPDTRGTHDTLDTLTTINSPQPTTYNPQLTTKTYTIGVLGDSMIETMGQEMTFLKAAMHTYYPNATFKLLNFGFPARDAEYGLSQLPSLLSKNPDLIVVESFAYNPWSDSQSDLDKQWLTLAKIVSDIKSRPGTKIVMAATIAPNGNVFGDGALNWSSEAKWSKVNTIKKYLENAVRFAKGENLPLADAYHPSLGSDGNGITRYTNPGDHLHPSFPGHDLLSQKIAQAIWKNRLL